jgi:hypothetical protein
VRTLAILIVPLAAACGRGRFDVVPPSPDAPVDVAAPDAAPPVLSCASPPRFSINATATQLSATARLHGYDVFTVDGAGQVQGFSYAFDTDDLATARLAKQVSDVPVGTNATGSLGALAIGDDVLVAMPYGRPTTTGTALIPLSAQLGSRGSPAMHDGAYGAGAALAGNTNGTLAFATQPMLKEVDLQVVSPLGVEASTVQQVPVTDGGADMNNPTIMAVGANFLVVWNASGSPSAVHAQLFDEKLVAQTLIMKVSTDQGAGTEFGRAAYAAAADLYLVAWHQKTSTGGGDEVWISLRNSSLAEIKAAKIASQGVFPAIAAGDNDFLVVWQDGGSLSHLGAARIAMDGAVTPVGVPDTGGTAAGWDLVVHNGQPAVAWVEAGGTGPNLWLDPLCH